MRQFWHLPGERSEVRNTSGGTRDMSNITMIRAGAAALLALGLAACQGVPQDREPLSWFSDSDYDPEIKAIDEEIPPPPAELGAGLIEGGGATMLPAAADVRTADGAAGGEPLRLAQAPTPPPLGYSRQKRVNYGSNRGPFSVSTIRTLR